MPELGLQRPTGAPRSSVGHGQIMDDARVLGFKCLDHQTCPVDRRIGWDAARGTVLGVRTPATGSTVESPSVVALAKHLGFGSPAMAMGGDGCDDLWRGRYCTG